ncbi:MAG TPA: hypothetical protein VKQ32_02350 [Polyangia bacterium]|nr:hypothetical protein [Polyangia bacterium]
MSRPLQVYLNEEDLVRLEAWSRERGWTKSQAVRAAVRSLIKPKGLDPLLDASGMIEGLPANLSADFDRHLNQTYVIKTPPSRGRRKTTRPRVRR